MKILRTAIALAALALASATTAHASTYTKSSSWFWNLFPSSHPVIIGKSVLTNCKYPVVFWVPGTNKEIAQCLDYYRIVAKPHQHQVAHRATGNRLVSVPLPRPSPIAKEAAQPTIEPIASVPFDPFVEGKTEPAIPHSVLKKLSDYLDIWGAVG
jgi:hypothetical protein